MLDAPGIYSISAEEYHRDPCPTPSLSSSIAKILCTDTPLHAWTEHPRLNPNVVEEEKDIFDLGTLCHSLLLEGIDKAVKLEYPDWRTKAAREAKVETRAAGKIPILAHHWDRVEAMMEAAHKQLAAHADASDAFSDGKPEQTIIWLDDGVWCRARLDWLHDSFKKISDYKSTGVTANPEAVSRSLFNNGLDIQAAFYLRGLKAVTGVDATFKFVFQETAPPYALSVIALGPDSMIIGEKKVMYALEVFRKCLESNEWPGYPIRTCYAVLPEWEEIRWLQKEEAHAV